jgi:hypothetical protein
MIEVFLRKQPDKSYQYVEGVFLTVNQLEKLLTDFEGDDKRYIFGKKKFLELWIKSNTD